MRLFIVLTWIFVFSHTAVAEPAVGLSSTPHDWGRAEAVTAASYGTSALFYNPASLAFHGFGLQLLGVGAIVGLDSRNPPSRQELEDYSVHDYLQAIGERGGLFSQASVRAFEVHTPYAGMATFGQASLVSQENENGVDQDYFAQSDVGVVAGLAIRFGQTAIGYSHYALVRAGIYASPTLEERDAIVDAVSQDDFNPEDLPFSSYTDVAYGGARGHNVGIHHRFWEGNPSGIALAVLNAGGTTFKEKAPFSSPAIRSWEEKLDEESARYGLTKTIPDEIEEHVNAGICLGLGGESEDWYAMRFGLDVHDIGGDQIEHKLAASYDASLTIPDRIALLTSFPLFNSEWVNKQKGHHVIHMGLYRLGLFGGVREGSHVAEGGVIGFHFGVNRMISVLKLDIEAFSARPLTDSSPFVPHYGGRATLALTFMI